MQNLIQQIIHGHEERINEIGQLKQAIRMHLQEMKKAHQAMSVQMRADLTKSRKEKRQQTRAFMHELSSIERGARDEWYKFADTMRSRRHTA